MSKCMFSRFWSNSRRVPALICFSNVFLITFLVTSLFQTDCMFSFSEAREASSFPSLCLKMEKKINKNLSSNKPAGPHWRVELSQSDEMSSGLHETRLIIFLPLFRCVLKHPFYPSLFYCLFPCRKMNSSQQTQWGDYGKLQKQVN